MNAEYPMLENILGQGTSLHGVLSYQLGDGRSAQAACARLLRGATGRVIVSGMGASLFAAMPATAAMARGGITAQLAESAELLHFGGDYGWTSSDAAILISRSGASVEVLRLAEVLRARGVRLVGVTNVAGSPLTELADETLLVHAASDQIIAVQTYTGTVLALQLLAEKMVAPTNAGLAEQCAAALPGFDEFLRATVHESESWGEFLGGDRPLYLLGRGGALAAVHEGSLLFHETAKLPAVGMSSAQFRHGPVEAIAAGTRVVVIGSPERTRSLDGRLSADLSGMGAQVRWIGPAAPSEVASLGRWPVGIPEVLAPLFDAIPLQLAAYVAALQRGVVPGAFRFASEITEGESGFPLLEASLA